MWDWLSQTALPRAWPEASAAQLTSQHFWDHMDRIDGPTAQAIWQQLLDTVLRREHIPLSQVCYDGTNFYTFIDTFNLRCQLAKRGKNKQGAPATCARSVTRSFARPRDTCRSFMTCMRAIAMMLKSFRRCWSAFSVGSKSGRFHLGHHQPTLIFDKGNNSADNFALIDSLELPYVGSVKLDEHPDLAEISNEDTRWQPATEPGLEGTKSWRTRQGVYGQERTLVLTYNQNLFDSQWATVQNDLAQALGQLAAVQRNLQDRAAGRIKGGAPPTVESVERKCEQISSIDSICANWFRAPSPGIRPARPQLSYQAGAVAQQQLKDTYLGKTLLVTSHKEWSDAQIIRAYRSQFVIEEIFHEMKDRHIGAWWPLHHWTDSKIQVHGLYCTLAVLLRALLWRRARQAGLRLSMSGLLEKLGQLRQVINVFPAKRTAQPKPEQEVLTAAR